MRTKVTKAAWDSLAFALARDAHENHMESHRGVWFIEDRGVLCLYNNHPYAGHPTLRDAEVAEFRQRMDELGIEELAFATYPPPGDEDAGYTFALLIDAGEEATCWVIKTMMEIHGRSIAPMFRNN
jgi:hypothetical protein